MLSTTSGLMDGSGSSFRVITSMSLWEECSDVIIDHASVSPVKTNQTRCTAWAARDWSAPACPHERSPRKYSDRMSLFRSAQVSSVGAVLLALALFLVSVFSVVGMKLFSSTVVVATGGGGVIAFLSCALAFNDALNYCKKPLCDQLRDAAARIPNSVFACHSGSSISFGWWGACGCVAACAVLLAASQRVSRPVDGLQKRLADCRQSMKRKL